MLCVISAFLTIIINNGCFFSFFFFGDRVRYWRKLKCRTVNVGGNKIVVHER